MSEAVQPDVVARITALEDRLEELARLVRANAEHTHHLHEAADGDLTKTQGRKAGILWEPPTGRWRPSITVGTEPHEDPELDDVWIDTT